jgi:hypothetical protein
VIAMMTSGLTIMGKHASNRDSAAELKKAIISIQRFAGSASQTSEFKPSVKKLLSTFREAAGIKEKISMDQTGGNDAFYPVPDQPFLVGEIFIQNDLPQQKRLQEIPFNYKSIQFKPDPRPPRRATG